MPHKHRPPRGGGNSGSSYRPPPPPPPPTHFSSHSSRRSPPPPPPPPPSHRSDVYQFGSSGDHYRPPPQGQDYWADRPSNRNFARRDAPNQPHSAPGTGPSGQRNNRGPRDNRRGRGKGPLHRQGPRTGKSSRRPLMQLQDFKGPTTLLGADENQPRFKALEDLSEDEGSMSLETDDDDNEDADAPPNKKVALGNGSAPDAEQPKWSNPDPYTALPPPNSMHNAGKKAIDLIRKARMSNSRAEMAANDNDFISFDDDNGAGSDSSGGVASSMVTHTDRVPPANAPKGPRATHPLPPRPSFVPAVDPGPPPPPPPGLQDDPTTSRKLFSLPLKGSAKPSRSLAERITTEKVNPIAELLGDVPENAPPPPKLTANRARVRAEMRGEIAPEPVASNLKRKRGETILDTPWLVNDYSGMEELETRLHQELLDFYDWIRPREYEDRARGGIIGRLQHIIVDSRLPGSRIQAFGSYPAGIYLPTADMDLVAISNQYQNQGPKTICQTPASLRKFANAIRQSAISRPNSVIVIGKAKVPLVKYTDNATGVKVDVSFENFTGITANGTYERWKQQYPAMPCLVTFIKQFLAMRGLNEVHTGGIGGFTISCLVVSLLQNWPECKNGEFDPAQNLGKTLLYFLEFYGTKFDFKTIGIQFNPPGYFLKADDARNYGKQQVNRLLIVDPNNEANDISGGSAKIQEVLMSFERAYDTLKTRHQALLQGAISFPEHGLLGPVLASDYGPMHRQRDIMHDLVK